MQARLIRQFRLAFIALAVFTAAGTAVELATLRHWNGTEQKVPWLMLAVTAAAIAWQAVRPSRHAVLVARSVAGLGMAGSGFGVFEHVHSNWDTAPLSAVYADTWDSLSLPYQVWLAASGGVGGSPPLAPGFLALSGICLALSTLGWAAEREERD